MSAPHRILVTYKLSENQLARIANVSPDVEVLYEPTPEGAKKRFQEAEILFGDIPKQVLVQMPRLRWVQISTVGADLFLYPELLKSDVTLCCSRGMHKYQMTELLFGLMVGISRKLFHYYDLEKEQMWTTSLIRESETLVGKTLGIVGLGSIGSHIAKVAHAFGMKVAGTKRSPVPMENVDEVLSPSQLGRLLEVSDHVVNVSPLTSATVRMFGEKEFRRMKRTAVFYNLGRGASVDTAALIQALESGTLKAAALDTFEEEPLPADHPLWKTKNLFITPHIGGPIPQYTHLLTEIFIDNLRRYLDGRPLGTIVDKAKGY
jgi:phosphoglycerate dehydrogenase-like enzyme